MGCNPTFRRQKSGCPADLETLQSRTIISAAIPDPLPNTVFNLGDLSELTQRFRGQVRAFSF
jgi:hypothetical protein